MQNQHAQNDGEDKPRWIGLIPSVSVACFFILLLPLLIGNSQPANALGAKPSLALSQAPSALNQPMLTVPQILYTITSNYGPVGLAYDSASGRLFIANQGSGSLQVASVIHRVFLPIILRTSIAALNNSGNGLNSSTHGAALANTSSTLRVTTVADLPGARGIAFDAARNRIYVVGGGGALYIVDGQTMTVTTKYLGNHVDAYAVAYNPANSKLYIASPDNNKIIIVPVTDDVADEWKPIILAGNDEHPLWQPFHAAVNPVTGKAYISNHHSGIPGCVTVIDGSSDRITKTIYLGGDPYGIAVDSVHNRVYASSISAARVYVIDGETDTPLGDFQIVRASDGTKVPLRMVSVNPSVGANTHVWLTSNSDDKDQDLAGMDRLIVISGNWPNVGQAQAVEVAPPSLGGGLLADPASWFVFASSAAANLVTVAKDSATLSWPLLRASATASEEHWYTLVHEYSYSRGH